MRLPPLDLRSRSNAFVRAAHARSRGGRTNVLTISLEDYFHAGAFGSLIPRGQWYRFESRIEKHAARTLDLLDEFGISATFFVLGCVAERFPELVRSVRERGHEVASKGYQHRLIHEMSRSELSEDLLRAREAIESASGQRVLGCRISGWITPRDAWALDVIAEQGYLYDSSMRPFLRSHADTPETRRAHLRQMGDRALWEFPVSSVSMFGCDVPLGGGNWFRQLPHPMVRRAIARCHRDEAEPIVLYFQTWELDPGQPRIEAASSTARLRHYRNLHRMPEILRHYFSRYAFSGVAEWLGAQSTEVTPSRASGPLRVISIARAPALAPPARSLPRVGVSVVIPCFNEAATLPYLANTLRRLEESLGAIYDLRFVIVDDGSVDASRYLLRALFSDWANVIVLRHDRNRGMAAALETGMLAATTDIVCSMDCGCTFDPHELARMIPLLRSGVDVVIASPYHPEGVVHNLPAWRRVLSRGLSVLYGSLLRHQLYTYTSCFRVHRRSSLVGLETRRAGAIGVTELLVRLDLAGATIVEHPVTLEARIFGRSKMKLAKGIAGHVGLLAELAWLRLRGAIATSARPAHATHAAPNAHERIAH